MSRTERRSAAPDIDRGLREGDQLPPLGRPFWLAVVLWIASIILVGWAAPADPTILGWAAFTTVGALLAWIKPRHPVGWLLITDGLLFVGGTAANRYVTLPGPIGLPESITAAAFDLVGWIVGIGLIPLILLLVPTGRLVGRWERMMCFALLAGGGLAALAGLISRNPLPSYPSIDNPFEVSGVPGWVESVGRIAEPVFFLGVIGALVLLVVRFLRSTGGVRQQMRWLAFGGGVMLIGFLIGKLLTASGLPGEPLANALPMLVVPIAIGVAVLGYRLWDLDLVVRGTIVYGLVAVSVTAGYVILVAGVGAMAERSGAETWLAILATAIAATLFQPIRQGATAAADRLLAARRPAPPELMIRTLGGFRVERQAIPVPHNEWRSRKARQLLKMLVARRGRPLHREQATEQLWPESGSDNLANRLAVALSTLRSVLDPAKHHPADHYIKSQDGAIGLDFANVTVDLELFLQRASVAETLYEAREAQELYRGDFLGEDLYEEWARPAREEAREAYLNILRKRAELSERLDPHEALDARLRILEVDPWDETVHLSLIAGLRSSGRHGEARRAQKRYEDSMVEIGVVPERF